MIWQLDFIYYVYNFWFLSEFFNIYICKDGKDTFGGGDSSFPFVVSLYNTLLHGMGDVFLYTRMYIRSTP